MTQRIYVACLASYNSGRLHGEWIDASADVAEMQAKVSAMLRRSPYPNVIRATYRCEDCGESQIRTQGYHADLPATVDCEHCGEPMPMDGKPYPSAEEWAIHDHEGLGDLGEYCGLETVAKRFAFAELAEERDIPLPVILEATESESLDDADDAESWLDDHYRGTADSWADFAQELTEETHDMDAVPEWLRGHIDWQSVGRDMEISGDFHGVRHGGELYIFWNH